MKKEFPSEPDFIREMKERFAGIENKKRHEEFEDHQNLENSDAVLTDLEVEDGDMSWEGTKDEFYTLCNILHEAQAFGEEITLSEIKGTLRKMFNIAH